MASSSANSDPKSITQDRETRLILTNRVWNTVIRALSTGSHAGALAFVRQHGCSTALEFLCDDVQLVDQIPSGDQLKPMDDWLFISLQRDGQPALKQIEGMNPGNWQNAIWLSLSASRPGEWKASVMRHGHKRSLEAIYVIGPPMLCLRNHTADPSESLPDFVKERWSRQIPVTGESSFERLRNSVLTIIGCGGNGTPIAFHMAAAGVGTIRLFDDDILQLHNMNRNLGVPVAAVGAAKVAALGAALKRFRPDLNVVQIQKRASWRTLEDYLQDRSDVLITCTDSDTPRLGAAIIARRNLLVHLDVATSIQRGADEKLQMTGDVTLLLPTEGCCSCVGGFADPAETRYDLTAPPGSLRRLLRPAWNQERVGSLATLNSMVVGAAAQTLLDLYMGEQKTSAWHRFAWHQGQGLQCHSTPVNAAADCAICHMFSAKKT